MLRYLIKTLLQMNLFTDTLRDPSNSSELLFNLSSIPSFNTTLQLDWGNFTSSFNGSRPRLEDAPPRIVEHPSDLIVSKGEPATLNCKAEGRPSPMVEWYKDGERVETDREDPRSHRMLLPSGSLFFLRIVHGRRSKPDEGVYVCVARNYLGEAVSRNASLEVAILRDDFRQTPSDVVVAAGEPAVMECIPPRGHPEPTISWKRNNMKVNDHDERITIRGGKLMISNTRKSDAGMFVCVGTNMVGERDSDPAELVVFERPMFVKRPVNQVVLADDMVDFLCEAHGDPAPTIRWRREEGELPRGRSEIRSDHSLRLTQVRAEDEGTYTCVSENSVGKAEASGSLQVHVPPQIVVRPRDQITAQGRTVTFLCGTKGNPPPAVFWQKEGSQILLFPIQEAAQSGRYSVSLSGELTITDVLSEDSGYYICQAISVAGSILTKALLEVESAPSDRVPPIIRQGPANQTLAPGSTAQLQCHVMGNPLPSIQWEKDGQRILGDERVSLMEKGTFQITNLQETDSGAYTCVASSSSGETTWSGVLTVKESGGSSVPQASEPFQLPGPPQKPVVTDVTRNSVTLTWQPNAHEGGAAVTSYIIEAFSQSAGSTWQTVADLVKLEKHTVSGLFPNTIYLFIVRAVNAYGLSDPSPISEPVRTQDVSPTGQGVDHRQVQKELGEVAVQLQEPVTLTASSVQVSWMVDRQSQYIQGYRILYRPRGGTWQLQDVKAPSERLAVVADLLKGTEYEIKIRPYFDEFQGMDSRLLLVRTPEEVPSAPPKAVTVVTVKLSNSSSISVSWEPPPADMQNGIIQEYKVWCVGNDTQTRYHINTTVDGTFLSTVLKGLLPGILYQVEVAAVTSAGVGTHSQPVSILIKLPAEAPSVPSEDSDEGSVSLAEQITDVVKQPAFIAGIGGACWVILMSFSMWIYCRRKKRKELSHYTASFNYTPAVGFPHGEASGLNGRPGMLGGNMGNYPWLADSWPTTNLVHSGKEVVNCCTSKHDTAERYYNEAGISNYLNQTEKYSTGDSTEGPIYSTIDPTAEDRRSFNSPYSSTTPYASTPIMPFTNQALQGSHSPTEQDGGHWITQPGPSSQYAQPDRCRTDSGKPKQKSMGKAVKTPSMNWTEVLPAPPSFGELEQCVVEDLPLDDHEDMELGSDEEEWCPPLPDRTYLTEGCEDGPAPPLRGGASSPTTSYSHQSTATLTPSPREESHHPPHDTAQLHHHDGQQLARRLPCGPVSVPRAPSPPLTQSNPNLSAQQHSDDSEGGTPLRNGSNHRRDFSEGETLSADNVSSTTPVRALPSPADNTQTPPGQKSRVKKKTSKGGAYRREVLNQGDLPPPPEPPPENGAVRGPAGTVECGNTSLDREGGPGTLSSMERKEGERSTPNRKGSGQRRQDDEDLISYGKPSYLAGRGGHMSSNCSITGSSSSRGSTGSRGGHCLGRKRNEERRK
ncbi:roundabout homolog 3-like isoform X4 [Salvelinus sp. IW2-2015]|uniref:roundabout homolog 3-like isoform X4 n=2 Tax=Salvelinus sp. IW2-2015 TaxID=2691554 RepID=UPI000CDFCFE3|nr:roundabout homolog 3-like isoform X4 [Salvelinus alpinus]